MLLHSPKISGKRWVRAALSACGLLSNIIATNHTPRLQQIQHEGLHLQVTRRTKLVSQFDCPALLKQGVHRVTRICSLSCTLDCAGKRKWGTQLRRRAGSHPSELIAVASPWGHLARTSSLEPASFLPLRATAIGKSAFCTRNEHWTSTAPLQCRPAGVVFQQHEIATSEILT